MARSFESIKRELERRYNAGKIELPPLPEVAQRVLETASDPLTAATDLATLVHRDQGLAAEVLKGANSAMQAGRVVIVSLQQAVARLGIERVVELVIAASIRDGVFSVPGFQEELRLLWRRSLGTGLFAKEVARVLREDVEAAFLSGLLRSVGTALLIRALARLRRADEPSMPPEDFRELDTAFRVRLGLDAASTWGLPDHVRDAIDFDESTALEEGNGNALLILLAERLFDLLDTDEASEEKEEALRSDPILDELGVYPDDLDTLFGKREEIRDMLESGG
ncbi:MAG: HDOD domain-containing protein [bacterium]|nr:HDOD domain-containing protein [bacterium]